MLHYAEEVGNMGAETEPTTETTPGTNETGDNTQTNETPPTTVKPITSDEKADEIPKPGSKKEKKTRKALEKA